MTDHSQARADLAAVFRIAVRLNWHEGIANHFSLAVNDDGTQFLMNPNLRHFARVRASDLLLIDANDRSTMDRPDAPDPTAWGLHGALHRAVPWARCALHLHPKYATALASLADSTLPPVDQNSAMFFDRVIIDEGYGGLALEDEGTRICSQFTDPRKRVMLMGNHGVMVVGKTVGEAFTTLYYYERAAETYITALSTGRPLRVLSDNIAAHTAAQMNGDDDPGASVVHDAHLAEWRAILDAEGSDYAQ